MIKGVRRAERAEKIIRFARDNFSENPGYSREEPAMLQKIICFFIGHRPKLYRSGRVRCTRCWKVLKVAQVGRGCCQSEN